ncbi:MAG TPA: hypothetical protein VH107_16075 [Lacipirellulaceae bacterium]|nr:hypothetical protein [Lacipirellulaceae bacterium]
MLRALLDAAIAGVVFTLVSSALVCAHAKAGIIPTAFHSAIRSASIRPAVVNAVAEPAQFPIVQIATASSSADAVYRQTSVTAAWTLLGIAFSLMVALNLALVRHLRRAYAIPVRRFPLGK